MTRIKKCNHTIFNNHCQSCTKLQNEWYKKIATKKDSNGEKFEDIERNEEQLKFYSSEFYSKDYPVDVRQAKQEYHIIATYFLNEHKFEKKLHKVIWEYHTNGISMREISDLLKKVGIKKSRGTVCNIINDLKKILFDKYLVPKKIDGRH